MSTFSVVIFFIILVVYVVGAYIASKAAKSVDEYYITGRRAGVILVLGAFAATWISAVGSIGFPGMSYSGGIGAVVAWGAFPGFILCTLFIAPRLYRSKAWTLFDYLGDRFDSLLLRGIGVVILFFGLFPYLISQIMGAGTVLSTLTGFPYRSMIILTVIVFFLITIIGGAWSVTVTDTIMLLIMFASTFLIFPFAISWFGGWDAITFKAFAAHPERFTWTGSVMKPGWVISTIFIWMFGMFFAPHQSTRLLIAKDERTMMKALVLAIVLGMMAMWCLHIMAAGLYEIKPDLKAGSQAIPYLFGKIPYPGIGGLAIAGIFAAALSTATSMLLVLGFGVGRDVVQKLFKPDISEKSLLLITKIAIFGWALATFLLSWNQSEAILKWGNLGASLFACTYAPAMIFGLWWKGTTRIAVISSMLAGFLVDLGLWIPWNYFGMKLPWYTQPVIWGLVAAFVVIIVVSLFTKATPKEIAEYEKTLHPAAS